MPTLVDLTHPLAPGQPNYPSDPKFGVIIHNTLASIGHNLAQLSMSTHQGTHLDAPYHFFDNGATVDQIPLESLFGQAVLLDLAPGLCLEPRTPITLEMFLPHEDKFRPGAKIIYRTGFDRWFGTPEFFTDYPSMTIEAAQWIADKRIGLLGMDTPTPGAACDEIHRAFLRPGVEIVLVEALANLDRLPERFTLAAFPLKLEGRDGSPIRAVAIWD